MAALRSSGGLPLNLGCGARSLPGWLNLDLVAAPPDVVAFDLRDPLPLADASTPFVYSSHLIEHLAPADAQRLVGEIWRVLEPGGVVRLVVPDLEKLARWYLEDLERGSQDLDWSRLHLVDQLTRWVSGGEMKSYLRSADAGALERAASRMGSEASDTARPAPASAPALRRLLHGEFGPHFARRVARRGRRWLTELAIRVLAGRAGADAWKRATFAMTGENHRWMYDRVNLSQLLSKAGFQNLQRRTATTSGWPGWAGAQSLDLDPGGEPYKPESIWFEGTK